MFPVERKKLQQPEKRQGGETIANNEAFFILKQTIQCTPRVCDQFRTGVRFSLYYSALSVTEDNPGFIWSRGASDDVRRQKGLRRSRLC